MRILLALAAALPLVLSPASHPDGTLMVMMSGDGGWARIDRELTARLNRAGVSVIGLDARKYLWSRRSAGELARAIGSIIDGSRAKRVVLAGYSRGADLMPFALNRLTAAERSRVSLLVLLSPSRMTDFELHLADYFRDAGSVDVVPEMTALRGREPVLCVYGSEEANDTLCTAAVAPNIRAVALAGGHHYDGDYEPLARLILGEIHR